MTFDLDLQLLSRATTSAPPPQQVDLAIETANLNAADHELNFAITGDAADLQPTTASFSVSLSVLAKAFATTTSVSVVGRPTLGEAFYGIRIHARDSDNLDIEIDDGEDFKVKLFEPGSDAGYECGMDFELTLKVYEAQCSLPSINQAGSWSVTVSLDDVVFVTRLVQMMCPSQKFENAEGVCQNCPDGVDCTMVGAALNTLSICSGYWRASSTSAVVLKCFLGSVACFGTGPCCEDQDDCDAHKVTNSTDYCADGYKGPLCNTCSRGYFMNWAESTCDLCTNIGSKGAIIAPLVMAGTTAFLAICALLYRRFYTRTEEQDNNKTAPAEDEEAAKPEDEDAAKTIEEQDSNKTAPAEDEVAKAEDEGAAKTDGSGRIVQKMKMMSGRLIDIESLSKRASSVRDRASSIRDRASSVRDYAKANKKVVNNKISIVIYCKTTARTVWLVCDRVFDCALESLCSASGDQSVRNCCHGLWVYYPVPGARTLAQFLFGDIWSQAAQFRASGVRESRCGFLYTFARHDPRSACGATLNLGLLVIQRSR